MIPNQWYAVLESREVRKGVLVGATRLGERLVFWRDTANNIRCLRDKCVHRGASLAIGNYCDDRIACPFHGFEYDGSGKVTLIPANGRVAAVADYFSVHSFPVRERHGMVYIWWGDRTDDLPEPPVYDDIDDSFSCSTTRHLWPVHYSRAVENQLDLVHVPFVHYNTIGRGNKTLVNGPVQRVREGEIEFWVYNEVDNGQTPKKADALPPPDETRQHIHFKFPNIWQNWILPKLRVFVAFVPVDETNTLIYLRTYQKFSTLPLVKQVIDFFNMRYSIKILNQDKRVVITQLPIKTSFRMQEKLIAGDLPIITYRKIRQELISKKELS
jgi:phenylpropionate dioxygenase-like ring-hydroxylating dioxygenase large terminal subunit